MLHKRHYCYSYLTMPPYALCSRVVNALSRKLAPSSCVFSCDVQVTEQVPTARAQTALTLFQCKKCTVCGCHLGAFPKLILFSQLWNILFFQFQNLLMLKREREIQSAQLRFAKQIMQPAQNLNQTVIFITTAITALLNLYSPGPPKESVS